MTLLNQISEEQNTEEALLRLKAQNRLYSEAKLFQCLHFILCVCLVVAISLARNYFKCELLSQFALLYSIAVSLLRPFLLYRKQTKVDMAACIQQLFDISLYHFEWEDWLCGNKPNIDDIHKYANKIHSVEGFENWYDKRVGQVPLKLAILICIRSNVSYDRRLRENCQTLCKYIIMAIMAVLFCYNFSMNEPIMDILLYQAAPLLPIAVWGWDIYQQFSKNLTSLECIRKKLDDSLDKGNAEKISTKQLCQLQNMLFLYRKSNFLIPDWIYNRLRSKHEEEIADMVGEYINQ
jgi:hypothetical protein